MATIQVPISKTTRFSTPVNFLTFAQTDPVNGNSFANNGSTWLVLDNKTGLTQVTISVVPSGKVDNDLPVGNRVFVIPAGDVIAAGAFDPSVFNDTNGMVTFTSDGVIAVIALTTTQ